MVCHGWAPESGKSRLSETTVVRKTRRGRKRTVRTFAHFLESRRTADHSTHRFLGAARTLGSAGRAHQRSALRSSSHASAYQSRFSPRPCGCSLRRLLAQRNRLCNRYITASLLLGTARALSRRNLRNTGSGINHVFPISASYRPRQRSLAGSCGTARRS